MVTVTDFQSSTWCGSTETIGKHWFSAQTEAGLLKLAIQYYAKEESDSLLNHRDKVVIDAACAMGQDEHLIQWVENWLGIPLELELSDGKQIENYLSVTLASKNTPQHDIKRAITLYFPASLYASIHRPEAPLINEVDLEFSSIHCTVRLDEFFLPAEQANCLQQGSLLLLPASFNEHWSCQLYARDKHLLPYFSYLCDVNANALTKLSPVDSEIGIDDNEEEEQGACSNGVASIDSSVGIAVEIDRDYTLPFNRLLAWQQDSDISLLLNTKEKSILNIPRIAISKGGKTFAIGCLISLGSGYGVLLNTIF